MTMYAGLIERYREYLPVTDSTPIVSLLEGATPLIRAPRLAEWVTHHASRITHPPLDLYVKFEGLNPTCSFKDRGMTMAVTKAAEAGMTTIMCASTGNTSASAAAYAARAGMQCTVLIPGGKIALGKLAQAIVYGARVLAIEGNFDDALRLVRDITSTHPIALVNSVNPFRLEGQKTAAFEIVDDLGRAPDFHALPVGNAGNITAYWMGYKEYRERGRCSTLPRMLGFQAAGAAPIVDGAPVANPETVATAIRIGNPASWKPAVRAIDESCGHIGKVTDDQILEAWEAAASLEGIFAEPASVAPIAGLRLLAQSGYFTQHPALSTQHPVSVVVTLTGHGLTDPQTAVDRAADVTSIPATRESVLAALGY
jgi:threonine synthase